jgi:hypothetical protein
MALVQVHVLLKMEGDIVANTKIKPMLFAILTYLSFESVVLAEALPKVGERVYVIKQGSAEPVSIEKDSSVSESEVVLRDPSLKTTKRAVAAKVVKKPVVKVVKPIKKNGQMTFKPTTINGNMKNPRVEFQREYLKVGIAEESYSVDFFQKVNEPLTNSDF